MEDSWSVVSGRPSTANPVATYPVPAMNQQEVVELPQHHEPQDSEQATWTIPSYQHHSEEEEVRTLFVSCLPMDAKPRELYLLFRGYKDFEKSFLKVTYRDGTLAPPVGFVTFKTRAGAEAAKEELKGVRFDPDIPHTIKLQFAKSNTKGKKASLHSTIANYIPYLDDSYYSESPEMWPHHLMPQGYVPQLPDTSPQHPVLLYPASHPQISSAVSMGLHEPALSTIGASYLPGPSLAPPVISSPLYTEEFSPYQTAFYVNDYGHFG